MSSSRSSLTTALALLTGAVAVAGLAATALVTPAAPAGQRPRGRSPLAGAQPGGATEAASTTTVGPTSPTTTERAPTSAAARLTTRLDAVLANTNACLVVEDASGVVYHHGDASFVPASTQKLLVAAAALDILGPTFRFATSVVSAGPPDAAGAVDDLWLVGGGDPVLSSPDYIGFLGTQPLTSDASPTTPLIELAAQLEASGVRQVRNGLHGDDSRYERLRWLPTWKPIYFEEADVAPLGALEVDDGLQQLRPERLTTEPALLAATALARLAGGRHIAVAPAPDAAAPPGATVLASVQSPPLAELVSAMIRSSDNLTAELLVREIDRARGGSGTTGGGTAVVLNDARKLGLPVAGVRLLDGSGLSPADRATCPVLVDALALASRPPFTAIATGLSVAGRNGTLVHRFGGTPAEGHLAAKTGSIDGVAGLVGILDEHQPVRFALLINGRFAYAAGIDLEDRIVAAVGTYPEP